MPSPCPSAIAAAAACRLPIRQPTARSQQSALATRMVWTRAHWGRYRLGNENVCQELFSLVSSSTLVASFAPAYGRRFGQSADTGSDSITPAGRVGEDRQPATSDWWRRPVWAGSLPARPATNFSTLHVVRARSIRRPLSAKGWRCSFQR